MRGKHTTAAMTLMLVALCGWAGCGRVTTARTTLPERGYAVAATLYREIESAMDRLRAAVEADSRVRKNEWTEHVFHEILLSPRVKYRQFLRMNGYRIVDIRRDKDSMLYPYYALVDCYFQAYRSKVFRSGLPDEKISLEFTPVLRNGVARMLLRFDTELRLDAEQQLVVYALDSESRAQQRLELLRRLWGRPKPPPPIPINPIQEGAFGKNAS